MDVAFRKEPASLQSEEIGNGFEHPRPHRRDEELLPYEISLA
jgi:hypothetical protein